MCRQWDPKIGAFRCYFTRVPLIDSAGRHDSATWEHLTPGVESGVVLVADLVNKMKADMSEEQFMTMVITLARHFEGEPFEGLSFPRKGDPALKPDQADEATRTLSETRVTLGRAVEDPKNIPRKPGLYAVFGTPIAWKELGLGRPPDARPLYVGKSESSLLARDINTHFGNGRTGQSTVRRSVAALLRGTLGLRGMPRNPVQPGYFANYGLSREDDEQLTSWMKRRLTLAVWAPARPVVLSPVETSLIQQWAPPLNLTDVATRWTARIKAARKVMADEARTWRPDPRPR